MSRPKRHVVLTLAVLFLALTAAADWKESYRRGRDAFEAGRWREVIEAMREAIADRSEERSGTGFLGRRYTPRYFLGAALAEMGNCRQALQVFSQAEAQGQIQETVDARDLQQRMRTCRERLEAARSAREAASAAVQEARSTRESLAALERDLGTAWRDGEPSLEAMRDQADRLMRQAQQRLTEGERAEAVTTFEAIRDLAVEARDGYRDTAAEARSRRAELARQRVEDARTSLAETVASAERSLRGVRGLAPYPPELARRVRALESLAADASVLAADASPATVEALRQRLTEAQEALNSTARRPARSLLDAAERFLDGDYAGTLEALEGTRLRERRARDQICLLRAAAAWSLRESTAELRSHEAGGGGDSSPDGAGAAATDRDVAPDQEATAGGDAEPAEDSEPAEPQPTADEMLTAALDECRSLDPLPVPHPTYFSPRFIRFFDQQTAPPADPDQAPGDVDDTNAVPAGASR